MMVWMLIIQGKKKRISPSLKHNHIDFENIMKSILTNSDGNDLTLDENYDDSNIEI